MANKSPKARFDTLPVELVLDILHQRASLEDLDAVLEASPAASLLFSVYGREIVASVLRSKSSLSIPLVTRDLIYATLRVHQGWARRSQRCGHRQCKCHHKMWRSLLLETRRASRSRRQTFTLPVIHWEWRDDTTFIPCGLLDSISIDALRKMVSAAGQAASLAANCLAHCSTRFAGLQPKLPASHVARCQQRNVSLEAAYAAPSWLEQQRVYLAAWRIQLSREMKLSKHTAKYYCDDVRGQERLPFSFRYALPGKLYPPDMYLWYSDGAPFMEYEILDTVQDYINYAGAARSFARCLAPQSISHTARKLDDEHLPTWQNSDPFNHLFKTCRLTPGLKLDYFRGYGFAFWDSTRIRSAGYIGHGHRATAKALLSVLDRDQAIELTFNVTSVQMDCTQFFAPGEFKPKVAQRFKTFLKTWMVSRQDEKLAELESSRPAKDFHYSWPPGVYWERGRWTKG